MTISEKIQQRAILICLDDQSVVLRTEYMEEMALQAPETTLAQTARFVAHQLHMEGERWALCRCRFGKNGAELSPVPAATKLCELQQPLSLALVAEEEMVHACEGGEA
ncbi:MAG: hypothetical protein Q4F79_09250 [Eubacteriales bacterium]|nr:hypothetical protein [Eubacteriales bacterium]